MAFIVWPRGTRLVPYTSPSVMANGKAVRLRVFVPEGWVAAAPRKNPNVTGRRADGRRLALRATTSITISPPPNVHSWLPEWLRRRLYGPVEQDAAVELYIGINWNMRDGKVERRNLKRALGVLPCAFLGLGGEGGYSVLYSRGDRAEFERTYRTICQSLEVAP
jgi:hypothetical protein